jgi:hypothetical protein
MRTRAPSLSSWLLMQHKRGTEPLFRNWPELLSLRSSTAATTQWQGTLVDLTAGAVRLSPVQCSVGCRFFSPGLRMQGRNLIRTIPFSCWQSSRMLVTWGFVSQIPWTDSGPLVPVADRVCVPSLTCVLGFGVFDDAAGWCVWLSCAAAPFLP